MLRTVPGTTDRRIDELLALLADNPLNVISGARIAKEIGVTRATVWRWVQTLRSLGVKVKGHPRTGYQVERVPDLLVPQLLRPRLTGTLFGKRIHHFFKIGSTNEIAFSLGQQEEPHGAVVLAEEQTAGRGRAGRTWHSEKSAGIYVSILLRPAIPPGQAPALTLLAGLAARDAVFEQTGLSPDLRWPNDLLLKGKKLCGVLTEMQAEPFAVKFVVVGIGLNINHTSLPESLKASATSLRMETGRVHSRLELLVKLLRAFDRYYNRFLVDGAVPIVRRFEEVSSFARGKRVRISNGREIFTGVTSGLEPSGLLRVARDDVGAHIETVVSGDVTEVS
jgi:BirA family biotin operon repressor/biotin-[acetyl-CoA-carboxylase] ligase